MIETVCRSRTAAAIRARAVALSRSERPLFLSLMSLLLALWIAGLFAVGNVHAERRDSGMMPLISLVCTEVPGIQDVGPGRHI